ncbi:protein stoned-A [Lutzomyia longipalpis]|uniref:protein stoned-A n=1 Tax=Lutzomyia longipalpis TaxID=7200 RepID=UPI002483BB9B|nr:protein stoned-A [Lutzomyia longipalpis]XP_055680901.1 protein stoned-A [Lutzomyia longipalpis]XP_055680902.1 protein stoned-A [Lutzomyia longipalpis]
MLKLPKGLKKKKKGKKSKKDKELFTEEELEQYRREHQKQAATLESEEQATTSAEYAEAETAKPEDDDEWRKFNALATGVDSILKKTQGDLDRIKSTSFFQRVPPPSEKQKKAAEEVKHEEGAEEAQQPTPAEEVAEEKDNLAAAVIELSESESESEEADDIFDTTYIDVITTNELPLAYIPDSPVQDEDDGPDPFDTTYAEKVIKGPEVSKKGKKIVSIGSAVEVLTGRVETVASTVSTKRPRRGVQNLLLEDAPTAEEATAGAEVKASSPVVVKTLLDDNDDVLPDIPIDLSVSLHLTLQKEKAEKESQGSENKEKDVLAEFDELKPSEPEDDEFAQLATESLTKVEEVTKVVHRDITPSVEVSSDWAAFEEQQATEGAKGKPSRPPPPRPAAAPQVSHLITNQELDLEEEADDVDPFDTAFVDKVVLVDDDEFDPRAEGKEEEAPAQVVPASEDELFSPDFPKEENLFPPRDYLGGSYSDLSTLPDVAIAPAAARPKTPEEFDPFDTSAVSSVVVPKEVELKFLERELLADNTPAPLPPPVNPLAKLKPSLSDPDFDPRGLGEEENPPSKQTAPKAIESRSSVDIQSRKSSLSLNIQTSSPKAVSFVVPTPDLLAVGENGGKIQKPLTPYYNKEVIIPPSEDVDPFDTSFVSEIKPTQVELSLLESDLLNQQQQQQQYPAVQLDEDSDFDPRADSPTPAPVKPRVKTPDLLAVGEEIDIKVLTPAVEIANAAAEVPTFDDPFDTSGVDSNILPGKVELKLIENELLPHLAKTPEPVLDILSYSQDDSLPVKALTPLGAVANSVEVEDIDPFDTSIAENLGPGKTEIKLIESELIGQDQ